MLNFIFAELTDGILKDIIRKHEKEARNNPLLQPIESEIKRLENIEEQIKARLEALKQLHQLISGIFNPSEPEPEKSEDTKTSGSSGQPASTTAAKPELTPKDQQISDPKSRQKLKAKKKMKPGFKRLPKHRATGNPRLDALEASLHDALECLNNTKLAFYVKEIKEVRTFLEELYKIWDKPGDERLAELETGLKTAVNKMSANSRASKSKVMQNICNNIIVVLQNKEDNE